MQLNNLHDTCNVTKRTIIYDFQHFNTTTQQTMKKIKWLEWEREVKGRKEPHDFDRSAIALKLILLREQQQQ